ncbi:MAG: RagB/SusD family nutrient uptake outer membrane protein [Bacteroidales bacterium]|nr:RagB/SusD family nutrient uptake outer membrane protein [Bacteroidales bacterium]
MRRITAYMIILTAFALASCSLEENPQSEVTQESFYNTLGQCRSALRALYTPLHYIYTSDFMHAVEGCTDIWGSWSADENAYLDISPAKPGVGTVVWRYCYIGIMRANECIECIADAPIDSSDKWTMVAEARAMRSLYYYILTSFFGDVPYYTYAVKDIETMEKIRALPRKSADEIRAELYVDLRDNALPYFTEENGLRVRAYEIESNHAGFALTAMMMAKMAMWNEEWGDAIYALKQLEDVYGTLDMYPIEEIQWRYKNTAEGIFEIQHEWSSTGVKFYGSVANVMTPTCNDGLYDGVYMPELSQNGATWTAMKPTKHYGLFRSNGANKTENAANAKGLFTALPLTYGDELYAYDEGGVTKYRYCNVIDMDAISTGIVRGKPLDKRTLYKFGYGNLQTGEIFTYVKNNGIGHPGPQFWCPGMTNTYDSNNYRIFRYADAVLMMAECCLEEGDPQKAIHYLDQVRERAGVGNFRDYTNDSELMREIQNERARELGGEFHRKFDLVRWGIWYDITKQYNEISRLKDRMKPCHRYYPIPDTECALSGYVLTNDEYAE